MSSFPKTSGLNIPAHQRAWLITRKGTPQDAVSLNEKFPVPSKLQKGEVLVKVQAAAFNPIGYKLMGMVPNFLAKRPHVAEHDLSGVVVDANDSEFKNGQAVYGIIVPQLKFKTREGALAEYTKIPAECLVPTPEGIKPTESAGLGYAGLTAYQALFKTLKLEPGQSIFINGGSTSLGMYAIQMAKAKGCTVTVTGSTKKEELLRSLGADHFIDYTKGPLHEQLIADPPQPKFHVIFEAVGNADWQLYAHSESYLAPGGTFASVGPHGSWGDITRLWLEVFRPSFLGGVKRPWTWHMVKFNKDDLRAFNQFVADGAIKPKVDTVYDFADVHKAYERIMSSRATGKVVVKVDPDAE